MDVGSGYVTYITAAAMVAYGVAGFFLGFHDGNRCCEMILGALALFGLRRAVGNVK